MDLPEFTKIISNRIQKLEPENALKIIGCLFLKEPTEQEMVQLALGPDNILHSKINDAKNMLNILASKTAALAQIQPITDLSHQFNSFSHGASRPFSSPATFHVPAPYLEPQLASEQQHSIHDLDFVPRPYPDTVGNDYSLRNQMQFLSLDEQLDPANTMGPNFSNSYYYQDAAWRGSLTPRNSRRSPSLPEFPLKACHYFYKGYCKHGTNCRYFHGQSMPDGYSQVFSQNMNELANEEHGFPPGSLEKLEMEITELLKSRNGPISIASLPMLYYEKYGRNLQAEGYLTESQRHGKAGFSLTKLLARLKNSIRLIDRPHGQHCVVLTEDEPRYVGCRNERNDPNGIVASSHQIYLTFPAESTFNEEDVAKYFRQFGPVRDVRIPFQDKRMFGFVSFIYPESVTSILSMRNPHYICGARVLVKPYREKSRIIDRTYLERIKPATYYPPRYAEVDAELHALPRDSDSSRLLKKQLIEEQEKMIGLEQKHLSELNLGQTPLSQQPHLTYNVEDFKVQEGPDEFSLADHFTYTLDALNDGSTSDDKARHTSNSFNDQDSQIELPESPFASPTARSSISAVI